MKIEVYKGRIQFRAKNDERLRTSSFECVSRGLLKCEMEEEIEELRKGNAEVVKLTVKKELIVQRNKTCEESNPHICLEAALRLMEEDEKKEF